MIQSLIDSKNGKQWYNIMPDKCKEALVSIERKLSDIWDSNQCVPSRENVLLPFTMISPDDVAMIIICKEPYSKSTLATGIPIQTGNGIMTPSSIIFSSTIRRYWRNVTNDNYMDYYYKSGILVINASFTIMSNVDDKRYSLAYSHYPLWCEFTKPFIEWMNSNDIPILCLGLEAKSLMKSIVSMKYICSYPRDIETSKEFIDIVSTMMSEYIFDIK